MSLAVIGALVRLRLVRVLRDRQGLVWLLVMPMVFSYLMGKLMGGGGASDPATDLPTFMVFDRDQGAAATELLAPLANSDVFRLVRIDSMVSAATAQQEVEDGNWTAVLLIPAEYTSELGAGHPMQMELFYDSERLSSQTVNTLLDKSVLRSNTLTAARGLVTRDLNEETGVPRDRARRFDTAVFDQLWENPRLTLDARVLGRVQKDDWGLSDIHQHLGPAYVLFFMMMFLMMGAKELVAARQDRTLARLVTSRATALDLVLGFFLGGMAIGLVQSGLLLVLNSLAFGLDYGDSLAGLLFVVVLFAGFSSGAALVLGCSARTGAQADGLGMALTMSLAALGGLWWPLEVVPVFMQKLGHALPTGQAITVFHDMIGRGYGVAQMSGLLIGLALWCGAAVALAAWRLRRLVA